MRETFGFPRWRTCLSKKLYTKARYARLEAERQGLFPYKCPWCTGWHLSKKVG